MKLGAEPKKLAALAGLLVVALIVYYLNSSDSPAPSSPRVASTQTAAVTAPVAVASGQPTERRPRVGGKSLVKEFKPMLGVRDPKDRPDPATIDPTIRWDLLAKVQNLDPGPPGRNVFQFGSTPPPAAAVQLPKVQQIAVTRPPPSAGAVRPGHQLLRPLRRRR